MELTDALRRVNALIAKAEHPNTPPEEADTARRMADALMMKFAIDEAMADAARPVQERGKPDKLEVDIAPYDSDIAGYVGLLARYVARHTRCKIREWTGYNREERMHRSTVYGYPGDLNYFQVLFTTLRLHMLGVLAPGVDAKLSLEDNAYRLHSVGFNWIDIAKMYGWRKVDDIWGAELAKIRENHPEVNQSKVWYYLASEDKLEPITMVGSRVKRAYYRAIAERGEEPLKVNASSVRTFRINAAQGYVYRINRRLTELERSRDVADGARGALALRMEDLEDFWKQENQDLYTKCPHCGALSLDPYTCTNCGEQIKEAPKGGRGRAYKGTAYNPEAYQRGVRHANTADLGGGVKEAQTKQLG